MLTCPDSGSKLPASLEKLIGYGGKGMNVDDIRLDFLSLSANQLLRVQERPPLASALQNFETALMLLAHGRHPQALAVTTSSIESAGKAHLRLEPDANYNFATLNADLNSELPKDKMYRSTDLQALRKARNRIVHFGFSARDDEESVRLMFGTALPFLDTWLTHAEGISPISCLPDALAGRVQNAVELVRRHPKTQLSSLDAVRGVIHWVLHFTRLSYLTWWERRVLDSDASSCGTNIVSGWELKNELKSTLVDDDPTVVIDCPICQEMGAFVLQIEYDSLQRRKSLVPLAGRCIECDLDLPVSATRLLRDICSKQLTSELGASTAKEYGIK